MRKIPTTMASQHPDHANSPYWHNQAFIGVQDEYKECYLTYSDLGVEEYKWDWEGKLVDESVIERLLSQHHEFFQKNPLGVEKFLTFRLPNPKVETEFRIGRAFIGILSAAAMAKHFGFEKAPLFEVILPMTESAEEMIAIQEAFTEISGLKHSLYKLENHALESLEVVPLFESAYTIINSDTILKKYVKMYKEKFEKVPEYIRPYVARSDPALNAGLIPNVFAIKIAFSNYLDFTEETGIPLYPIIGCASLPFRGGLTPDTVEQFVEEYKGVRTVLLQSGFRYDYPKEKVMAAIKKLHELVPQKNAAKISIKEREQMENLIPHLEIGYRRTVEGLASLINQLAGEVPKRRERVQHNGLFGYSRGVGKVKLPRAIGFTAALYSIGLPPEMIGTGRAIKKINEKGKQELLQKYYRNIKSDLQRAGRFINKSVIKKMSQTSSAWHGVIVDIEEIEEFLEVPLEPVTAEEKEHAKIVNKIYQRLMAGKPVKEYIEAAGKLRRSLG